MAGHSKWSQIKRSKGAKDVKRGAKFAKFGKMLAVAIKSGGGADPEHNPKLRSVIERAKAEGLPNENIKKALDKGEKAGENIEEIIYEGYLPGGIAAMVFTATDNSNRTFQDVRQIFTKSNGSIGTSGCVAYMFKKRGEISVQLGNEQMSSNKKKENESNDKSKEELLNLAIEAGAEDLDTSDPENIIVITQPENLHQVQDTLSSSIEILGGTITESKEIYAPEITVAVTDLELAKNIIKAMEAFEDNDDVIDVAVNFEIDDSLI